MTNIKNGMIAGFAGTVVLSGMMLAKGMMGVMPQLDPIHMIAGMIGASAVVGWVIHFTLGTIAWGAGFSIINGALPGKSLVKKGIAFGIMAWLMMMVAIMPMVGAGLFGLSLGMAAPVMTIMMHVVFGAVLGKTYQALSAKSAA